MHLCVQHIWHCTFLWSVFICPWRSRCLWMFISSICP